MRVLVVKDKRKAEETIVDALKSNGFVADVVQTLEDASAATAATHYDATLLDREMPDGDELAWLRAQRRAGWAVPVLILAAEINGVGGRVEGLNAGADDCLVKPVNMEELVARLRAVLRRPADALEPVLRAGNLKFDPAGRQVWIGSAEFQIPRREVCLLEALIRRFGRVVPRTALEENLYSYDDAVSSNAIEVGVYRLRSHLAKGGATVSIRTARGVGYALELSERNAARQAHAPRHASVKKHKLASEEPDPGDEVGGKHFV